MIFAASNSFEDPYSPIKRLVLFCFAIYLAFNKNLYSAVIFSKKNLAIGLLIISFFIGQLVEQKGYESWLQILVYLSCFLVYLTCKLDVEKSRLINTIIVASFIQALLVIFSSYFPGLTERIYPFSQGGDLVGSIGNREFCAVLIGFGMILCVGNKNSLREFNWLEIVSSFFMILALILLKSKGTLALLLILLVFKKAKFIYKFVGAFIIMIIIIVFFPETWRGRVLLWLTGLIAGVHSLPFGGGTEYFYFHYLSSLEKLYGFFPQIKTVFGDYAGLVADPHNIFLQVTSSGGLLGLGAFLLLLILLFRDSRNWDARMRILGLFILVKMMYTVTMTNVLVSLLVFLFLFLMEPDTSFKKEKHQVFFGLQNVALIVFLSVGVWMLSMQVINHFGKISLLKGDVLKCEKSMELYLEYFPKDGDALLTRSHLYFIQGKGDLMDKTLKEALQYKPDIDCLKIAAHAYFFSGNYNEALDLFKKIHYFYPKHLSSIVKMAQIYEIQGSINKAKELAQYALDLELRRKSKSDAYNLMLADELKRRLTFTEHNGGNK